MDIFNQPKLFVEVLHALTKDGSRQLYVDVQYAGWIIAGSAAHLPLVILNNSDTKE
jgi:hypothetical protein